MRISQKSRLDGLSNGLLIKPDGHAWGRLARRVVYPLLISFAVIAQASAAPTYPLKKSANGRYLVDQNDVPFLMVGDSPQALMVNISETDAAAYFADRSVLGFNTVWINLLCTTYTGGRTNSSTYDGITPFTANISGKSTYDLTTPRESYFARVDAMINLAASYGLLVVLDPIETGGYFFNGTTMQDNGTTKCRAYGRYLGNRYKDFPNIIWMNGNDYGPNPSIDQVVREVAAGIQDNDTNHIHTVEISDGDAGWTAMISLDAAYTYNPTYAAVLDHYNYPTVLPVFMVEAHYEDEAVGYPPADNNTETGTPLVLRRQEYWSMLSGATGQLYGNHYTWQFLSSWTSHLDSTGSVQMAYVTNLFSPRHWWDLVPDQAHTVVTAGYGTYSTSGLVSASDYLTAARVPDGSLVMAYMPTRRQITVDMTKLVGLVTARWYDPTNGTYATVSGSPFTNTGTRNFTPTGNNSAGDGDWVLVLEATAAQDTTAPSTPASLTATAVSNSQINLSWTASTDNVGVTQYLVERQDSDSASFLLIATPIGTVYSDTGLTANTTYTYRVRATDAASNVSGYSNTATATAQTAGDTTAPTTPSSLAATAAGSSQVNLSWTASTDNVAVTAYLIERSQGSGSTIFTQIGTASSTSYSDTGLSAGTAYTYRVRATDAADNLSAYSNTATATTSAATGLAAGYAFNEGSGTTTADSSGNGITGTLTSTTWTTAGRYGNALTFNGTSSNVSLGNPATLKLTGSMTVEAWVYATGNPADDGNIVAKSGGSSSLLGWQFKTSPDTGVRTFAIGVSSNGAITQRYSKTVLSLNTWYHVAGVYNAGAATLDIYVNGVLDDGTLIGTVPGSQADPSLNVLIGRRYDGLYFNGRIDEVRVYNRALSAAEIQTDLNTPVGTAANTAPTISNIADQTINEDAGTGTLAFTVGDAETAAGSLTVSGSSSNTTLVPNANIVFGGSGASRTVTVTPAANQSGTATITVTVSDGALTASDAFVLTVNAINDPPTISSIANQTTTANTAVGPLSFTVGDVETTAPYLTVSGSSSNTTLVPNANIAFGGNSASRTVTVTPAANQTGTATITVTVSDGSLTASSAFVLTVNASANTAPTISNIVDQTINEDTNTGAIAFTVGDVETAAGSLTLSGSSSNTALVPNANIVFGGSGASRTVTVTPAANQTGTATITVTVSDGALTASRGFVLTVNAAVNTAPTISAIADQTINEDTKTGAIAFTVGDAETAAGSLAVTGSSSNTALVPNANIVFGGSGAGRAVTVAPAANQNGTATITITVSDGTLTATDAFVLTVNAVNDPPTISSITNQTTPANTAVGPLSFTVGDVESPAANLTVSGASSNTTLVPTANIVFGGSGANRTVMVTPAANQTGTGTITVTVSDGSLTAATTFTLTVNQAAADTTAPSAPTHLTATTLSRSQISLSWTASADNVGVTGYRVERKWGFGSFVQVGTTSGTTFNDTGLWSRNSYSYRVRATDAAGNLSGYSNVATARTQ